MKIRAWANVAFLTAGMGFLLWAAVQEFGCQGADSRSTVISLMAAGWRDPLNPDDIADPDAPFNLLTLMIVGEARVRVFKRKLGKTETGHAHIGPLPALQLGGVHYLSSESLHLSLLGSDDLA